MEYQFFNPAANREQLEAEAARLEQRHYELTTGNFEHDTSKEAKAVLEARDQLVAQIDNLPAPASPKEQILAAIEHQREVADAASEIVTSGEATQQEVNAALGLPPVTPDS